MALPERESHSYWPPGNYEQMYIDVVRVAQAIGNFEKVTLYAAQSQIRQIKQDLEDAGNQIEVRAIDEDDIKPWLRDIAPTFVIARDLFAYGVDFHFNGWGGKDQSGSNCHLTSTTLRDLQIPACATSLVAEGAAIETDNEGTLLATESSLVNPNRNPGMDCAAIEEELKRILGIVKIIWLRGVRGADTTHCHVDALARFTRPGVVVLSRPSAARPRVWMEAYEQARHVLETTKDA